jgi:hypothetical protein
MGAEAGTLVSACASSGRLSGKGGSGAALAAAALQETARISGTARRSWGKGNGITWELVEARVGGNRR